MTKKPDTDPTLPSVVADLDGTYRRPQLLLTIAFHPDTGRIGETCSFASGSRRKQWVLGRNSPDFNIPSGTEGQSHVGPLADPGISRQALRLDYGNNSLVLERVSDACRCRVNGQELDGELTLGEAQLKAGVAILLAHRVLLLLREVTCQDISGNSPAVSPALRGSSPYMADLRNQIASVAASDLDVLIRGETGTGKELVASAIHANSARAASPLVPVNMSAIPADLAPAALFGSAKGAYTGADSARMGYFEQAQGGILFLDEVGDTPLEIQAQLLRALQQREIQCVGGGIRQVDLRVIAATDAPLEEGSDFKAALRHRLGGCEIMLEPLRWHPEDIGELLWFFLREYLEEAGLPQLLPGEDSERLEIAAWAELFDAFLCFSWPGNVRQLSNFARQVALASDRKLVLPRGLSEQLRDKPGKHKDTESVGVQSIRKSADITEDEFLKAMAAAKYEPTKAAQLLKIPRTAVYRLIENSPHLQLASQVSERKLQAALAACKGDINEAALQLKVSRHGLRARLRSSGHSGK